MESVLDWDAEASHEKLYSMSLLVPFRWELLLVQATDGLAPPTLEISSNLVMSKENFTGGSTAHTGASRSIWLAEPPWKHSRDMLASDAESPPVDGGSQTNETPPFPP